MARIVALVCAVIAIGAGAYFYLNQADEAPQQTAVQPEAAPDTGAAPETDTSGVAEMALGDPNAPVTIIEYASYTCPHCASFHEGPFKQIKKNYIDTGKVRFIYREVYFDRYGLWASMIARCAGPDRFFAMNDLIYKGQSDWARGEPTQIADALRKIGRLAGLDDAKLTACLEDGEKAQQLVTWYQKNAEADEITGTPSFVVNGKKVSNQSYSAFAELLDAELAN